MSKGFLTEISQALVSSSLAGVALGPVGLDTDGLLGIIESFLVFGLSSVDSRSVGEEDVVFGFDFNSLRELLTVFFMFHISD